jgi:hypothetical protein
MTEAERDTLMQFLHTLKQTRLPTYDKLVADLVNEGVGTQPRAAYLLVHRCLVLEAELEQARRAQGGTAALAADTPAVVWGQGLSAWGANAQGTVAEDTSPSAQAMAYLLRDAGKEAPAHYRSLEDKAVKFLGDNAAAVWLGIGALACVVVYASK